VFTIEDAVGQLKTKDPKRTDVEKAMDEFFMTHLPEQVIGAAKDHENNELDEDAVRRQMRSEVPMKRYNTLAQPSNDPQALIRIQSPSYVHSNKKRQKSDLTLAFMDSSPQIAKLAQNSEVGQKIDRIRNTLRSHDRRNAITPLSKFNNEMVMGSQIPRARASMNPGMFEKKYSKDLKKKVIMTNRIGSIVSSPSSKHKTITDYEESLSSHTICTEKRDAPDS
jgi:hypothetical protein